jgi:hypothetical protein
MAVSKGTHPGALQETCITMTLTPKSRTSSLIVDSMCWTMARLCARSVKFSFAENMEDGGASNWDVCVAPTGPVRFLFRGFEKCATPMPIPKVRSNYRAVMTDPNKDDSDCCAVDTVFAVAQFTADGSYFFYCRQPTSCLH